MQHNEGDAMQLLLVLLHVNMIHNAVKLSTAGEHGL